MKRKVASFTYKLSESYKLNNELDLSAKINVIESFIEELDEANAYTKSDAESIILFSCFPLLAQIEP